MKKLSIATLLLSSLSVQAYDPNEAVSVSNSDKFPAQVNRGVVPTTNYDDTIDGDYGDRLTPTAVSLMTESDRFIGNVGGGGIDFDDCFQFTIINDVEISQIVFESYTVSGGNTSTGFNVYTGTPPDAAAFGDIVSIAATEADVGTDLLNINGPLTAGTYTICMLEGTENQGFQLVLVSNFPGDVIFADGFDVTPAP